jgi:hypothetical protein
MSIFCAGRRPESFCPGMRNTDAIERGIVTMGTIQRTQRHEENCKIRPPSKNPKQRPRVPAAAKLEMNQPYTYDKELIYYKVRAIP